MTVLRLFYLANVFVAGWVGISSLFFPKTAISAVFENAYESNELLKLVGCLWTAIAILSIFGFFRPIQFSPVLLIQLIYKGGWLLFVAVPAIMNSQLYPKAMAIFFLIWVLILPFIIPWRSLFE